MTDRDTLMRRARAAVCFTNTSNDKGTELPAFMALFHPEHPPEKTRQLVNDARQDQRSRR